eukprot:ANDGO_03249.mRNA.1 tRNA (guanine(9)-N1)-methyltransferase
MTAPSATAGANASDSAVVIVAAVADSSGGGSSAHQLAPAPSAVHPDRIKSKNEIKREKRTQLNKEAWDRKRLKKRETEKEKRKIRNTYLSPEAKDALKQEERRQQDRATHAHVLGPVLVVDMQWNSIMQAKEKRAATSQVKESYAANRKCESPFQFWITSYDDALFSHITGRNSWLAHKSSEHLLDAFRDKLSSLVYLTADSPNTLSTLNEHDIYIIGGFVDRNRHKNTTEDWSASHGIRTARLPIANVTVVLTINQVVEILCHARAHGDWKRAVEAVVPSRKVKAQGKDAVEVLASL